MDVFFEFPVQLCGRDQSLSQHILVPVLQARFENQNIRTSYQRNPGNGHYEPKMAGPKQTSVFPLSFQACLLEPFLGVDLTDMSLKIHVADLQN